MELITWRPLTLPLSLPSSTIGRLWLNLRVRNGNGCIPKSHYHQIYLIVERLFFQNCTY